MNRKETFNLTILAIAIALSSVCWALALISLAATYNNGVWSGLIWFGNFLISIHLKPLGQCHIQNDWLCGMSHAFRYVWRGNIQNALSYNSNSLLLFSGMIIGCLVGIGILLCQGKIKLCIISTTFKKKSLR
jgi:hypothetical protein